MKKDYLPPSMTAYELSFENRILGASGDGTAPSFDGYTDDQFTDWITTNGTL